MPYALVVDLARNAILTAVLLSAPMLATALVVGLLVSVVQALTQVQEQTLTFVPKLLAVAVVFLLALPWMLQLIVRYAAELFRGIPGLVS
jgi:flagellar biosynthesis protein FliQ